MKNLPKTYRTRFSQGLRLNPAIACLATAWWVTLASPAALAAVKGWDSGLANDLFKDGNPPGQLREAKCKDKDCIDAMENLQAALNDWYALELSEGQQDKKDAVSIQDKADNKAKNDEGDAKIKEAIAGLGQPKDSRQKTSPSQTAKTQIAWTQRNHCIRTSLPVPKPCRSPRGQAVYENQWSRRHRR